ncbi:M23 family metallopeptidase [Rhodococcus sp. ARC_M6]|uniref:M23 family metallopeptidase n=1 Tax=Rhodococcus sp. ARC_M6 TaxID=2928852 RepID=UPI001FB218A5|nr:M23 family metallopeptidase [Rhodococcus sp. ARC_M6]MCJ0906745.1 M23 family metallopeptidase [Rhodococcus sp. ARC_M6]
MACLTRKNRIALIIGGVALVASCSGVDDATPATSSESSATTAPSSSPAPAVLTPVTAVALAHPIPVTATDGKVHLAYELFLTNTLPQSVNLRGIAPMANGVPLQSPITENLLPWVKVFGATEPTTILGPGQSALAWLDVTVPSTADIPEVMEHRISLQVTTPNPPLLPADLTETVALTEVSKRSALTIDPPLKGANWLDGNGCCSVTAHRGAVSPLNGQLVAPERFAIDYVQLTSDGKMFDGDRTSVNSYPYYGTDVYAVAAGKIVSIVNDLPEQTPGANPTGLTIEQYGGNHVVQDLGDGRFAFYAHLQTGSVPFKVGDNLIAGQSLGKLGNSGNTDAPHLHFHIMDGPDPLASNGLPFEIRSFDLTNQIVNMDNLADVTDTGGAAQFATGAATGPRSNQMPLTLDVMTYDVAAG